MPDGQDVCPANADISKSDFTEFMSVDLDPSPQSRIDPLWIIYGNVSPLDNTIGESFATFKDRRR